MVESQRASVVLTRGTSRLSVDSTTRVDKTDERGIEPGNPGAAYAGLLGNPQLILRLSVGQRVQMIQQLQRSHGNGQVARAIARLQQAGPGRRLHESRKGDATGPTVASTVALLGGVQRQ